MLVERLIASVYAVNLDQTWTQRRSSWTDQRNFKTMQTFSFNRYRVFYRLEEQVTSLLLRRERESSYGVVRSSRPQWQRRRAINGASNMSSRSAIPTAAASCQTRGCADRWRRPATHAEIRTQFRLRSAPTTSRQVGTCAAMAPYNR